jgi:hypothetical protein
MTTDPNLFYLIEKRSLQLDEECTKFYILGYMIRIDENNSTLEFIKTYQNHIMNFYISYSKSSDLNYVTNGDFYRQKLEYYSNYSNSYVDLYYFDFMGLNLMGG